MADRTRKRGPAPVQVHAVVAPDGRRNVLLQLPDGYVLMHPVAALEVADLLVEVAAEVAGGWCGSRAERSSSGSRPSMPDYRDEAQS